VVKQVAAIAIAMATIVASPAAAQQADPSKPPTAAELEQQMQRRRDAIANFESALERAVTTGARNLSTKLERATGTSGTFNGLLLSTPSAYGFPLPDFGLAFAVRVPGMDGTMVWAWATSAAQSARERQGLGTRVGLGSAEPVPPPISAIDADMLSDPSAASAAYRDAIKEALIDAMLENSAALKLGENETLTVAARREGRANPLDPTDRIKTVTFNVRGSVLEALRVGKIDLATARKQVAIVED
jgi:hypothetical protein